MKKILFSLLIILMVFSRGAANPLVQVKDIASLEGVRDNHLIGYGLVVGLEGSGDSTRSQATIQSITNMLAQFGLNLDAGDIRVRNVAAVMVTADLPPFTYPGERIDVNVSSLGDARSLQGGILLMTPLRAGDGAVYAVAQGPVSIGGLSNSWTRTTQHGNVAHIPGGALVEKEVEYSWLGEDEVTLRIREASFGTSAQLARVINEHIPTLADGQLPAAPRDPGRVSVSIPVYARDNPVDFVATILNLEVEMEMPARVVINERTGTVVIGHRVRISPVAIAHAGLNVRITAVPPAELDEGAYRDIAGGYYDVEGSVMYMEGGPTVLELVEALNFLGAEPCDIIAILQAIKRAGGLHAELEVM